VRFISPDLYVRINEERGPDSERLYDEWDALGEAGRAHYARIKGRLPPKLAEFIDTVCLHDAEWMGLNVSSPVEGAHESVAVINIRQDNNVLSLVYDLYQEPQWSTPIQSRIFSDEQLICLYDEVDLLSDVMFSHEILISNGRILRLVFFHFDFFVSRALFAIPKEAITATNLPS
jgi:hypothetical protein